MNPTLILVGLVFGRWWRLTLIAAIIGWPVLLLATGVMHIQLGLLGAAELAAVNTGVGVAIHQAVRLAVRRVRH
jgi:hypothetical protein